MSAATKTTVMALLEGDAQLTALLAKDPFAAPALVRPAIWGNTLTALLDLATQGKKSLVYPCMTYRVQTSTPTKQFMNALPAAPGSGWISVWEEVWNFEIWTQDANTTTTVEPASARLTALLHGTAFPLIGGGRVFSARQIVNQPDLPGPTARNRYGLFAYRLRVDAPAPTA
jgi:hypothetical protein